MILVYISVWIIHLRSNDPYLVRLLTEIKVLCHPFVRGGLALGNLRQRKVILTALDNVPQAPVVFADEVNYFIEKHALYGLGIELINIYLFLSTHLSGNTRLWAQDNQLLAAALRLNLAASVHND